MITPKYIDDFVIGMAGAGGDGIVSCGEVLLRAAANEGYYGMMTKSFGSQIRGGESSCKVRLATRSLHNPGGTLDVAVALSWKDFRAFGAELPLSRQTLVIYDTKTAVTPAEIPVEPAHVVPVAIAELSRQAVGNEKAKNAVVLGLLAGWFGLSATALRDALTHKLRKKSVELADANERAFAAGQAHAAAHPLAAARTLAPSPSRTPKLLADGNDLCAASAIFAGCDFFAGYPITPSTEIMQFFTREVARFGGAVLQAEDEIAGIGAALGASFAGKKAMTATSGPGMSLKSEILGLASVTELPLVIVDVQRGGPSTGIPTKAEQADLFQAAFSAHGDVLRPVLAPISVADTVDVTIEAFNIAETYQTPVILLSDQELGQRKEIVDPIDTSRFVIQHRREPHLAQGDVYARFADGGDGISPLSHPGMEGGNYQAAGIEHDERGAPSASGAVHAVMNAKRFKKLAPLQQRRDLFLFEGDPAAPWAVVAWGSVAGVCREACARARDEGLPVKLLVPKLLYPIAEEIFHDFFRGVTAGLVVELSHQGQLYRVLRMFVDVPAGVQPDCRSGANPFSPQEILEQLRAFGSSPHGRGRASRRPANLEDRS